MSQHLKITDAEWEIMSTVWEKSPITVTEIIEKVSIQKSWRDSTIRTLIKRLTKKGFLKYEINGKAYLYSPAIEKDESIRTESDSLIDRVFGGATAPLLVYLARKTDLSKTEIEELKQILEEKAK
jgi:BlaI family transcriptional regulator, penicillinase repressor